MSFLSTDLEFDANPVQRSKEENQERAFVAASRRKDRSLDARLESANRASMLHKKRTGKALLITKEIVEKEAMYEEVDERYQEKRLKLLKAHTSQLEAQFHRHLMATMAVGANNNAKQTARVSPSGNVQKMRNSMGSDPASYFPKLRVQTTAPISPTTTTTASSPTSPIFDMYGISSSSSESSFAQTPASECFMSTPMGRPPYLQNTGLMSPSVSPRAGMYQRLAPNQQAHMRSISIDQGNQNRGMTPYVPRQRASFPDAFMFQPPPMVTPTIQTTVPFQTSGLLDELSTTPSPTTCPAPSAPAPNLQSNVLPSPAISPPSMTSNSSQNSCSDNLSVLGLQPAQDQNKAAANMQQQPQLEAPEHPDPDYHEFLDFAANMDDQWNFPMSNVPFDEFVNLDGLDFELTETAF